MRCFYYFKYHRSFWRPLMMMFWEHQFWANFMAQSVNPNPIFILHQFGTWLLPPGFEISQIEKYAAYFIFSILNQDFETISYGQPVPKSVTGLNYKWVNNLVNGLLLVNTEVLTTGYVKAIELYVQNAGTISIGVWQQSTRIQFIKKKTLF